MRTELQRHARRWAAVMHEWNNYHDDPQNNEWLWHRAIGCASDCLYYDLGIEEFDCLTHPLIDVFIAEALATYRHLWNGMPESPFARYLREAGWLDEEA